MNDEQHKDLLVLLMMRAIELIDLPTESHSSIWGSEFEQNTANLKQTLHMIRKLSIELSKKI